MTLLTLLAAATVVQAPPAPIATYTFAGRTVEVRPAAVTETLLGRPSAEVGGWRYELDATGVPVRRYRDRGGWDVIASSYAAAKEKWTDSTPVWPVKIIVLPRVDVMERSADGLLRQRRGNLAGRELDAVLQQVGRFVVAAEAAAEGRIRLRPDVEIDADNWIVEPGDEARAFGPEGMRELVRPRINAGGFTADDQDYRGPFSSVFVLHAGRVAPEIRRTAVGNSPVTSLPILTLEASPSEDKLAATLVAGWGLDVLAKAKRQGASVGSLESVSEPSTLTEAVSDVENGLLAASVTESEAPKAAAVWSAVKDNPYAKLPYVADVPAGSITIPLHLMDFLSGSSLSDPRVLGITGSGLSHEAVLAAPMAELPKPSTVAVPPMERMWIATGNYRVETPNEAPRGSAFVIAEAGYTRVGGVILPAISAETPGTVLRFAIRSNSRDLLAIRPIGLPSPVEFVLGPADSMPAGIASPGKTVSLAFNPSEEFQTVQIDLAPYGLQPGRGILVEIGAPLAARYLERREIGATVFAISGFSLGAAGTEPLTPVSTEANEETVRAVAARNARGAELAAFLTDRSDHVILNAVAQVAERPTADLEPALIRLAGYVNPRIATFALAGLEKLNSETARSAIRTLVSEAPFDANRLAASKILAKSRDPQVAGLISRLWAGRSWRARLGAVETLAGLPGEDPKLILMVFLNQVEPDIRLRVTELADPNVDLVGRRLMWGAVNDPSDAVRSASYRQLLRSRIDKYRTEGFGGVKDDSPAVRAEVVAAVGALGNEEGRGALRQAVTDPVAEVRAAALDGFGKLPGAVSVEEIENTLRDARPSVQRSLVRLALAKKLALPADAIQRLRESRDPEVAQEAQKLGL